MQAFSSNLPPQTLASFAPLVSPSQNSSQILFKLFRCSSVRRPLIHTKSTAEEGDASLTKFPRCQFPEALRFGKASFNSSDPLSQEWSSTLTQNSLPF